MNICVSTIVKVPHFEEILTLISYVRRLWDSCRESWQSWNTSYGVWESLYGLWRLQGKVNSVTMNSQLELAPSFLTRSTYKSHNRFMRYLKSLCSNDAKIMNESHNQPSKNKSVEKGWKEPRANHTIKETENLREQLWNYEDNQSFSTLVAKCWVLKLRLWNSMFIQK